MPVDKAVLMSSITRTLNIQYITSRLTVHNPSIKGQFRAELAFFSGDTLDEHTKQLDLICPKPYHLTPFAVNRSSSAAKKESPLVSIKSPLALTTSNVLNLSNPSAIKSIKSIAVLPKTLRDPFSRCVSSPGMTDRNDLPKRRSIL
eukprot:gene33131-40883_t